MNKRFYLVLLLTIALTPLSFLHVNAAREIVSLELGYRVNKPELIFFYELKKRHIFLWIITK